MTITAPAITATTAADFTKDVIVRIYEIGVLNDTKLTFFTVSISCSWADAGRIDRDSDEAHDEVWNRARRVMKRDKMEGEPTGVTFVRETLIHSSKARPIQKRAT